MEKIYITITILILLVLGFLFIGKGNKVEAPVLDAEKTSEFSPVSGNENIGTVKEFIVVGQNFSFTPSLITVQKGDRVKIIFKNENGFHDFKIDEFGATTSQIKSPATEILEFTADKSGSFEYYCSVGSHRAMGMKGILKVE